MGRVLGGHDLGVGPERAARRPDPWLAPDPAEALHPDPVEDRQLAPGGLGDPVGGIRVSAVGRVSPTISLVIRTERPRAWRNGSTCITCGTRRPRPPICSKARHRPRDPRGPPRSSAHTGRSRRLDAVHLGSDTRRRPCHRELRIKDASQQRLQRPPINLWPAFQAGRPGWRAPALNSSGHEVDQAAIGPTTPPWPSFGAQPGIGLGMLDATTHREGPD
jgi:hypothetical protein